jgi:hypothetical protein
VIQAREAAGIKIAGTRFAQKKKKQKKKTTGKLQNDQYLNQGGSE